MNKEKKAQAAFEYLATYGWVLIILFFVLTYMITSGIFSESRVTSEECYSQVNLPCKAYSTKTSNNYNIGLILSNGMGYPIKIISLTLQDINQNGKVLHPKPYSLILEQGEQYLFAFNGVPLSPNTIQKLKVQVAFSPCKDKNNCIQNTYVSDIKIITKPVEGQGFNEGYISKSGSGPNLRIPIIPGGPNPGSGLCSPCSIENERQCNPNNNLEVQVCKKNNLDQLCWEGERLCSPENPCVNGECGGSGSIGPNPGSGLCSSCSKEGDTQCNPNNNLEVQVCKKNNLGQLCWVGERSCSQACYNGNCVETCSNSGDTRCNQNEELEVCTQVGTQLIWQKDTTCTTQCEQPAGLKARCSPNCKKDDTNCVQNELFSYQKCEKDSSGLYSWNTYQCGRNEKCLPNSKFCTLDNRPLCEPIGKVICGGQDDRLGLYRCKEDRWEKIQNQQCQMDCYKGECDNRPYGQYDECNTGDRRCTSDFLSVEECRGGEWVKIENCAGDTYCTITGPQEAQCTNRP